MASCCEDTIVPSVAPFVTEYVTNPDWKFRDAAVMALGSILEGPNPETLEPVVLSVSRVARVTVHPEISFGTLYLPHQSKWG